MKNIIIYLIFTFFFVLVSIPIYAMPCNEFNSIGEAKSVKDFTHTRFTRKQSDEFKFVIANHVQRITAFGWFSKRKKAFEMINDK